MGSLKAGIITQARMTSTRLPGKIFIKVKNHPLIKYHIDRLSWSGLPLFIATTTNKTDDIVADFAKKEGIGLYRGSEDNVLSRYYECAERNNLDVIIRVTSDCPLIDGNIIREALNIYLDSKQENLYFSNALKRTFPRGFDFEIFSFSLLKDAYENATETIDLEHVTPYINKNKSGKVVFGDFINDEDKSNIRITLDTPDDLTLIKKLIEEYDAEKMTAHSIIDLFDKNPDLVKINSHIEQKKA